MERFNKDIYGNILRGNQGSFDVITTLSPGNISNYVYGQSINSYAKGTDVRSGMFSYLRLYRYHTSTITNGSNLIFETGTFTASGDNSNQMVYFTKTFKGIPAVFIQAFSNRTNTNETDPTDTNYRNGQIIRYFTNSSGNRVSSDTAACKGMRVDAGTSHSTRFFYLAIGPFQE